MFYIAVIACKAAILVSAALLAGWGVKKVFPKSTLLIRAPTAVAAALLISLAVDMALIYCHSDPFFAVMLWGLGDGGSGYFIGPLYHIYKTAAYTLGDGSPQFFEYSIAPWLYGVTG